MIVDRVAHGLPSSAVNLLPAHAQDGKMYDLLRYVPSLSLLPPHILSITALPHQGAPIYPQSKPLFNKLYKKGGLIITNTTPTVEK